MLACTHTHYACMYAHKHTYKHVETHTHTHAHMRECMRREMDLSARDLPCFPRILHDDTLRLVRLNTGQIQTGGATGEHGNK